ncbi:MAG: hypothetical protein ACI4R8_02575 [Candidatus Caccovivens sp.]
MSENAITFDYKSIKVKREMETMVCDAYENLGWELTSTNTAEGNPFEVILSFKRNRKIENKMNLLKLEQKIDASLKEIESFQRKRKNAGVVAGISTGVVGILAFGGGMSMCLCLEGLGYLLGGIAISVVGVGIGLFAWWLAKKIKKKKSESLTPIIESELDNLADLCEKASELTK